MFKSIANSCLILKFACSELHWLDRLIFWYLHQVAYQNACLQVSSKQHPSSNHLRSLFLMRCRLGAKFIMNFSS